MKPSRTVVPRSVQRRSGGRFLCEELQDIKQLTGVPSEIDLNPLHANSTAGANNHESHVIAHRQRAIAYILRNYTW